MTTYHLAECVHVCLTPGGAVFLDLKRDRYFGLGASQARSVAALLGIGPANAELDDAGPLDMDVGVALLSSGLLVTDASAGRRAALPTVSRPTEQLIDAASGDEVAFSFEHAVAFGISLLASYWTIRRNTLENIVQRFEERKRRASACRIDVNTLRHLARVFFRFRAFAYTKKGQCLFDSLVLMNFLLRFGIHPTFVVGVRTQPFAAHSWVQHQDQVLNGTPEVVGLYTPILAV